MFKVRTWAYHLKEMITAKVQIYESGKRKVKVCERMCETIFNRHYFRYADFVRNFTFLLLPYFRLQQSYFVEM